MTEQLDRIILEQLFEECKLRPFLHIYRIDLHLDDPYWGRHCLEICYHHQWGDQWYVTRYVITVETEEGQIFVSNHSPPLPPQISRELAYGIFELANPEVLDQVCYALPNLLSRYGNPLNGKDKSRDH